MEFTNPIIIAFIQLNILSNEKISTIFDDDCAEYSLRGI